METRTKKYELALVTLQSSPAVDRQLEMEKTAACRE